MEQTKNSLYLQKCIDLKIPVIITGWEELGPVLLLEVSYNEFIAAYVVDYKCINGNNLLDSAVIDVEWLEKAIRPATKAGKVLFGFNFLTNEEE